jgi:hypothetical protein
MATYPAIFDIDQQPEYARVQIAIRILIVVIISLLSFITSWLFGLIYLAIPVGAAILIAQKGAATYLREAEQNMTSWLRLLIAVWAYMLVMTDRLPNQDPKETLRFDVTPQGEPTAGGVLLRIITAIPHAIVLGLIGIVSFVLLIVAGIMVLIQEKYPEGIFTFQRGYLRWNARVYAYMAGLAQEYPPFAFDTGPEGGAAALASGTTPPPVAPPPPPSTPTA